jgi:VWFA-related protein
VLNQVFLAGVLATLLLGQQQGAQQQQSGQQQAAPDAPKPAPLQGLPAGALTPGTGNNPNQTTATPATATEPPPGQNQIPQDARPATAAETPQADQEQKTPPEIGKPGRDEEQIYKLGRVTVNFVVVPVQVRDKHNQLVPGLTWRDFEVFEDNRRQRLTYFSTDAVPMSVALVIDQALTSDVMQRVNEALRAISGSFTPYDEIAVYTYANGVTQQTGFTAALGDRLTAVLSQSQGKGRDMGVPYDSGPMAEGPTVNGRSVDPNLSPFHSGGVPPIIPKEIYTLNDAIFSAGKDLAKRDIERRRVIYVISDGKEQGSHVSQKEVERFLLTNNIGVFGTVVGDSAVWGVGYLDKIHIPLLPRNNILPNYALHTGGSLDSEVTRDGIERSFQRVTVAARTEYTLGYNSATPITNPAYRKIEVRVTRPGLTIVAKEGYYPTPTKQ